MSSQSHFNHMAILVAGFYALAGATACDAPGAEKTPSEDADTGINPPHEPPFLSSEPNPDELYIQEIKTNGKGCPKDDPNSVETIIADDRRSFSILYQDMELDIPPGPSVKKVSCAAAVKLHVPNGYQVALATVNTRGYLYLDEDIKAKETSGYSFAGVPVGAYPHSEFEGPYDDFYEFSDNIPFESLVWSPCGTSAIFQINTTLQLNASDNPDGQAIFSTDITDGMFRTIVHWQIQSC